MKVCLAQNCNNSTRTAPDKIFFALPENTTQRKLWLEALSYNAPLKINNMYVCADHFDLQKDLDHRFNHFKVLKSSAVPHIFKYSANLSIETEPQNIIANTNNLNLNAVPKERNLEKTDNVDDTFPLFVKSVIAHLKQMPVEHRLKVKNKIENIMKRD